MLREKTKGNAEGAFSSSAAAAPATVKRRGVHKNYHWAQIGVPGKVYAPPATRQPGDLPFNLDFPDGVFRFLTAEVFRIRRDASTTLSPYEQDKAMQSGQSTNHIQANNKIRATVITGFLGAGKTTLIRHLIENANGRKIALIINEFGDLGIDGEVLRNCDEACCGEDDIIELANGCICCTVADDFIPTMKKLLDRENPPEHIVIETSGLALPQPLIRAFGWPEIRARVTVDGVVAIVDGVAVSEGRFAEDEAALEAQRQSDESLDHESPLHELFEDQVGCADLIVVSKGDLVSDQKMNQITSDLALHAQPGVRFLTTNHGKLDPEILLGIRAGAEDDIASRLSHHEKDHDGEELDHEHDDFDSFVVECGNFADQNALLDRIRKTVLTHEILRIKGFASIEGKAMRLQVQGVGPRIDHYYDRPWQPGETRKTSLVVIGLSGMDKESIHKALAG